MKEENAEARGSQEFLPDWSTSDKISGAKYRLGCALLKLKSTKKWKVLSCALGVTALVGGLVLAKTVGLVPAAIVAGVGVAASAANAVFQVVRSRNAKLEIVYTCDELDLLEEIAEREKSDPFSEFEDAKGEKFLELLKAAHELNFNYYGLKATDPDMLAACEEKYRELEPQMDDFFDEEEVDLDEYMYEHFEELNSKKAKDSKEDVSEKGNKNDRDMRNK